MVILMPCAGLYSRFPKDGMPKYIRPMNDMRPMFMWALDSIRDPILNNKIYFAIRETDEKNWEVSKIIKQFEPNAEILILDHTTNGPAHTIKLMLEHFKIEENFIIKDCDCNFTPYKNLTDCNAVYIAWRETALGDRGSKSWVTLKEDQTIESIEEKKMPKDWYIHGAYQFQSTKEFIEVFNRLSKDNECELFCSHIINDMLKRNIIFRTIRCINPGDFGTWDKYINYRRSKNVYFFDFDGVITIAGAPYGNKNLWSTVKAMDGVSEKIQSLKQQGHAIYIITSRTESTKDVTIKTLEDNNIPWDKIMFNVPNGKRIMINDYAASNPYPSVEAINTLRNSADWINML